MASLPKRYVNAPKPKKRRMLFERNEKKVWKRVRTAEEPLVIIAENHYWIFA